MFYQSSFKVDCTATICQNLTLIISKLEALHTLMCLGTHLQHYWTTFLLKHFCAKEMITEWCDKYLQRKNILVAVLEDTTRLRLKGSWRIQIMTQRRTRQHELENAQLFCRCQTSTKSKKIRLRWCETTKWVLIVIFHATKNFASFSIWKCFQMKN